MYDWGLKSPPHHPKSLMELATSSPESTWQEQHSDKTLLRSLFGAAAGTARHLRRTAPGQGNFGIRIVGYG